MGWRRSQGWARGQAGRAGLDDWSWRWRRSPLLLPESKTTRYEAQDRPLFEAKVKALAATVDALSRRGRQAAGRV
jgi:hypothetical protein